MPGLLERIPSSVGDLLRMVTSLLMGDTGPSCADWKELGRFEGYSAGQKDALATCSDNCARSYETGKADGIEMGRLMGIFEGQSLGNATGFTTGHDLGYQKGLREGHNMCE